MSTSPVVAILCSDLHLSHKPPRARAGAMDWYFIMEYHLARIKRAARLHRCPVLCAGDIFDTWASPPELINWVVDQLRGLPMGFYAIPGQHDLPNHRLEDMHRSAYETLVRAGVMVDLSPTPRDDSAKTIIECPDGWLQVWAYPWGCPVKPPNDQDASGFLCVAMIHAYCWRGKTDSHPGASPDNQITRHRERLAGYDVALFGDNHKPFLTTGREGVCTIFNHGGFIPRTIAEVDHTPALGLLHADGSIELDPAGPEPEGSWAEDLALGLATVQGLSGAELTDFIQGCKTLGADLAPFLDRVKVAAGAHPNPSVADLLGKIREGCIVKRQTTG